VVDCKHIADRVDELDKLYQGATGLFQPQYYSKFAVLEVSGWVEESVDQILRDCAKLVTTDKRNAIDFGKRLKKCNGFSYDGHVRECLICLVGLAGADLFERTMPTEKLNALRSGLNTIYEVRCGLAHTHVVSGSQTIDAPSKSAERLRNIVDALQSMESTLQERFPKPL
jgi:hypothetical protein